MQRHRPWILLAATGVLVGAVWVAGSPATTRQGVNFHVSRQPLPFYVKALDFLDRDAHYRLLAREITQEARTDEAKVLAVYAWTRAHIRPTPEGWPIVDDHILHIIIRGYGLGDQIADVFTTLCTYAGVPAFWSVRWAGKRALVVSFAQVESRWAVFDVAHDVVFRNGRGQLAIAEELAADPSLVTARAGSLTLDEVPYAAFFTNITMPAVRRPLRTELQMVWPRLWFEARRAAWLERS